MQRFYGLAGEKADVLSLAEMMLQLSLPFFAALAIAIR